MHVPSKLEIFMCRSRQTAFMTMLTNADVAFYIEGGTEIVFFTDELKNRDKMLKHLFYGKDCKLAADQSSDFAYLRAVARMARCVRYS